ncbi:hypothetical protein PBR20603_04812 [Pandoraea bronchicola]|uniref:Uncharacterized protein n=1 Tax=Pandoraea bronchicola TaxID=2508287 RepID=A0A5E5BWU1_9BURK|nr:hypothetical protein PBR20603_04812 [Pandoraea bronchicola]
MPCVVATRLPTFTLAVAPKYTPAGLTKNTWPGALTLPYIWLGLLSSTRFRMAAFAEGCWKLTVAALPTLNVCQLTTAFCEVCVTFMVLPFVLIVACPAATCPPVGNCVGVGGAAWTTIAPESATTSGLAMKRRRSRGKAPMRATTLPLSLPRARDVSATTTQARTSSLQIRR